MNKVLKQLESEVGRIQLCSLRPHALGPFLNYCFHCPPECVVDQLRAEGKWALISARGVRMRIFRLPISETLHHMWKQFFFISEPA